MHPFIRHILLPAITSVVFFAVVATPVEVIGCRTRGLLASVIALISILAGLGSAIMALRGRLRGDQGAHWWIASALVLAVPAIALIILA